ncbi:MAG: tail fiber domain-containing protein [Lewinellaceae bacterium]|nr:tail fiber domain-containing protein [Lewinellaceae bacterium]
MNTQYTLTLALLLMASCCLFSQSNSNIQMPTSVNSDGSQPNTSAMLDVQSTTQGMLVPRMTTAQRMAITSPATGLLVFDTDKGSFWFFGGTAWADLSTPVRLADADGNTKIQVEESPNEDVIRMDLAGSERLVVRKNTPYDRTQVLFPGSSGNISLGDHAGDSTSTGIANILIGENAGRQNKTGNGNTSIGFAAGEMGTANFSNTFIGQEAGRYNTSGDNTFVGAFAGKNTSSGGENTFLGSFTGINTTTGSFNTFLGRYAGQFNETGVSNTYVGHGAGALNVAGIGNVFIGQSAGTNELGSDKLYIENSAADNTGALIYGEFNNNLVRINGKLGLSRLPVTNKLEVEGEASKATPGEWLANSDARLKKNIQPLNSQLMLQNLLALHGVTYEWNDDKTGSKRPEGIQYGFTAQNIQAVFPTLVEEDKLGYLQTAYGTYDAMTVEAIRALKNENDELKAEVDQLKSQVNEMEDIKQHLAKLETLFLQKAETPAVYTDKN